MPRPKTPLPDHFPPPPLMTRAQVHSIFRGLVGTNRVDDALQCAGAPRPVLGGSATSKLLFNRREVLEWAEKISRPGCWPVRVKEAA